MFYSFDTDCSWLISLVVLFLNGRYWFLNSIKSCSITYTFLFVNISRNFEYLIFFILPPPRKYEICFVVLPYLFVVFFFFLCKTSIKYIYFFILPARVHSLFIFFLRDKTCNRAKFLRYLVLSDRVLS